MARRPRRGEFEIIARYFAPLASGYPLAFDLKDDAASLRLQRDEEAVLTADGMVEGVHFFPDDAPDQVAAKLLRSNLSDLAAKGARPIGYLLVAAWRKGVEEEWIAGFARGLRRDQRRFELSLIGGDTVSTDGPQSFALTAIGRVKRGNMIRRSGARSGHDVYVSGHVGDAHLGLLLRRGDLALPGNVAAERYLIRRHRLPEPRMALGLELAGLASAAVDVSDGLLADLGHICEASGLGAEIDLGLMPLSRASAFALRQSGIKRLELASGGDDYEICFTAPARAREALAGLGRRLRLPLTRIGRIVRGQGVAVRDEEGRAQRIAQAGYRHF